MLEIVIFGILCLAFLALFLFTILYYPIKNHNLLKNYMEIYGKNVYSIAQDYDYYLINKLSITLTDLSLVEVDHILFGEKYIYLIKDRYYRGGLIAKERDQSWLYYQKKNGRYYKEYIDNPLRMNDIRRSKVAKATGIDKSLFISIVLINNDCYLSSFDGKSKDNFLCPLMKLRKLIKSIEKRDVSPMNDEQLKDAVQDIARLNNTEKN